MELLRDSSESIVSDTDLTNRIKALSRSQSARPNNTERIREQLRHIEEALQRKATLQDVLAEFNKGQVENVMGLASFKTALKRVRDEHRGDNNASASKRASGHDNQSPEVSAESHAGTNLQRGTSAGTKALASTPTPPQDPVPTPGKPSMADFLLQKNTSGTPKGKP